MTKENKKEQKETPIGYSVFIDKDRNELLRFVFKRALENLKKDPVWLASQQLPDDLKLADMTIVGVGDLVQKQIKQGDFPEINIQEKLKEFVALMKTEKERTKEVNKLIMFFMEQEIKMGWKPVNNTKKDE